MPVAHHFRFDLAIVAVLIFRLICRNFQIDLVIFVQIAYDFC